MNKDLKNSFGCNMKRNILYTCKLLFLYTNLYNLYSLQIYIWHERDFLNHSILFYIVQQLLFKTCKNVTPLLHENFLSTIPLNFCITVQEQTMR